MAYTKFGGCSHITRKKMATEKDLNTKKREEWNYFGSDSGQCGDAFLEARIFGGKTFWETEQEIEWLDD